MAVLKCKMCGGSLDVTEGMTVCECEYCGTQQTITTSKDENMQGLFNRANILRIKSEFDKAEQLYEKLVQNNPDDAENNADDVAAFALFAITVHSIYLQMFFTMFAVYCGSTIIA